MDDDLRLLLPGHNSFVLLLQPCLRSPHTAENTWNTLASAFYATAPYVCADANGWISSCVTVRTVWVAIGPGDVRAGAKSRKDQ